MSFEGIEERLGLFLAQDERDWNSPAGMQLLMVMQPLVRAQCRKFQHSFIYHDFDDVVQNALSRITRSINDFQGETVASFGAWTRTIARSAFLDLVRKEKRERKSRAFSLDEPMRSDAGGQVRSRAEKVMDKRVSMVSEERRKATDLEDVLEKLREEYPERAKALSLKIQHPEATSTELAKMMDVSTSNFYQLLSRAKKDCARIYQERLSETQRDESLGH